MGAARKTAFLPDHFCAAAIARSNDFVLFSLMPQFNYST